MSTANLFRLPSFFQYGVGSAGFGAWRELAAHVMTTNWVLAGRCGSFPLLYHWRVLAGASASLVLFLEHLPHNLHQWLVDVDRQHPCHTGRPKPIREPIRRA